MTLVRPPPGAQVSSGRIRVDAAKAIAKLREYQLADRAAWILEAIRAAVASGATAIEITGDANDVWLAWDGTPWPGADLTRLFDELVSPEADDAHQHLRLLASGINSALGMDPAFVDVIAVGDAQTLRTRYTPHVIAEQPGDDAPLRQLTVEAIPRPKGARTGMLVHLHRKVSLDVIGRYLWASDPPEMAVARTACRDLAVPLTIGKDVLSRTTNDRDVLRVPLGEGHDGWLALTDPEARGLDGCCTLEVAERGVVLVRYWINLGGNGPIPLRVFVDAKRMPTNVARSQVRREGHPIGTAEARALQLIPKLVEGIAKLTAEAGPLAARARAGALAWLAAEIGGADWRTQLPSKDLIPLRALPLLRDATGAPRSLVSGWSDHVYTNQTKLPEDLRDWVGTIAWMPPGDAAALLLAGSPIDRAATRRAIRFARRQRHAHAKFYDHEPREPKVEVREQPRVRLTLGARVANSAIDAEVFEDIAGEICIYSEARGGELVILMEGREIERERFSSELGYDIVVDTKLVTPGSRYRGVARDSGYELVERAMRSAIACAIEALCVTKVPDGIDVRGEVTAASDARLVRLALPHLGSKLRGPLARHPVWPVAGDPVWRTTAELAKLDAIGVALSDRLVLAGRTILQLGELDRRILTQLLDVSVVDYDQVTLPDQQTLMARFSALCGLGLAISERGVRGMIWVSRTPGIKAFHCGRQLGEWPRTPQLVQSAIAIDSDTIVPNRDWTGVVKDGGVRSRDFTKWERALLRAIALALVGSPPPELHGARHLDASSPSAHALFECLSRGEPASMIGDDVVALLRKSLKVKLLGVTDEVTIDQALAQLNTGPIAYLEPTALPVPGYKALACREPYAKMIGALVKRRVYPGTRDLESARAAHEQRARRQAHATQPARDPAIARPFLGIALPIEHGPGKGVVGIAHVGGIELTIDVDRRPFSVIRLGNALPLVASINVPESWVDATFTQLPQETLDKLEEVVAASAGRLLAEIARAEPRMLTELGPGKQLLDAWAAGEEPVSRKVREALSAVPLFTTVRGEPVTLAAARDARNIVQVASWVGEWLIAEPDPPTALDGVVIAVSPLSNAQRVLERLHGGAVVEVTTELAKLQADRRMQRGLLPVPTLKDIPAELKCRLHDLGELGRKLGHGEIGLADRAGSIARIHDRGVFANQMAIDVLPPIELALEAPELVAVAQQSGIAQLRALGLIDDHSPLSSDAQELALRLVRRLLKRGIALPPGIRKGLRAALLGERIDKAELAKVPLFQTVDGTWIDIETMDAQQKQHGTVWTITWTPVNKLDVTPLDETRLVVRLSKEEAKLATELGWRMFDATDDLALDVKARRNRARPPVHVLQLPTLGGALGTIDLDGDGETATRGRVALLSPSQMPLAGVRVHREMRPLGIVKNPCTWPTAAVIDDARFVPDRAWEAPLEDEVWHEAMQRIRRASDQIIAQLTAPPEDAMAAMDVSGIAAGIAALREGDLKIAGTLWLVDPGMIVRTVSVIDVVSTVAVPEDNAPIGGTLIAYGRGNLERAVQILCQRAHHDLLFGLLLKAKPGDQVIAAHCAIALASEVLDPKDCTGVMFDCFAPEPIDATRLHALFHDGPAIVSIIPRPDPARAELAIVDDGSALSRAVIMALGTRAQLERRAPRRKDPAPVAREAPKPSAPRHPLTELAAAVKARLETIGVGPHFVIMIDAEASSPVMRFERCVFLAGKNPRLGAIANALAARSPWANDAVDALAAHATSILNLALREVTDVTETAALGTLLNVR